MESVDEAREVMDVADVGLVLSGEAEAVDGRGVGGVAVGAGKVDPGSEVIQHRRGQTLTSTDSD